ncbi:right-handed parallel beta-helix repeat-containing protein [Flavobacterium psychroterrae]|uniref:Right-handed parallel beta-helix repeat-containing protein n=1 Tax=Flavobacterium psychroterrae TaxID=2133767 RepID=A0ABS5PFP3_9FLAO|nr:right-handed parallel beta-helix repeat-containing protein [Flavobacterium psychroterrae]MBS7233070.1 right-handed parallel beta-helix repeat-containing protein [Flavobacterium psychroterrae]
MKKILLILLILLSTYSFAADVSGKVFLDNTSNFENSTITFTPVSPSAVLTQTTSQIDGGFTAIVANGIYNIKYEKNGYQTYELLNYFINGTITLNDVTLSSNNLVLVNGNVSGAWTKGNTYKVTRDIIVPFGQTLTIEKGVEIKFDGYYSLTVNGTIVANGSKDNYIKFTSAKAIPTNQDWNQITINSTTTSIMDYCIIEYGKIYDINNNNESFININGNFNLSNSIIRNSNKEAIRNLSSSNGNVNIINNKIYNCSYGILFGGTGKIIIRNNEVHDNTLFGIYIGMDSNSIIVEGNTVYNCNYMGILVQSNIRVERNIVFNNKFYGIFAQYSKPTIVNNTVMFNQNGIGLYDNETFRITNPIINSNIITNNLYYGIHSQGVNKPESVSYNLIYNNGSGVGNVLPVGVGPVITVNKNNTPSDAYYNIFVDPEFESTIQTESTFCTLRSDSQAVNAGDPSIIVSNGTIADIGAKELGGNLSTGVITKPKVTSLKVFPNPTTDYLSFETNENSPFDSIKFFDINGKNIDQIKLNESTSSYQWKTPAYLNKGAYFYVIMNGKSVIDSGKFIKI